MLVLTLSLILHAVLMNLPLHAAAPRALTLGWTNDFLTITGDHLPGKQIRILYLEAYCRPHSQTNDWSQTVVGHKTQLTSASKDGKVIELQCRLSDGVVVTHRIVAGADTVTFALKAHNPTAKPSEAHWGQPCIRLGDFTGLGHPKNQSTYDYLKKSFVFLDGELSLMPTRNWATQARYTPGQVWGAPGVPKEDLNPRPVSPLTPSNGLIGCFSADDQMIFATAFEPYQELFQGVITCLHSDFRIGGLNPGEIKTIRGTIYIVPNNLPALLKRYATDFPEHATTHPKQPLRP